MGEVALFVRAAVVKPPRTSRHFPFACLLCFFCDVVIGAVATNQQNHAPSTHPHTVGAFSI